jgi:translation initiation factor IF-3
MSLQLNSRGGVAAAAVLFLVAGSAVVDGFAPRSGLSALQNINTAQQDVSPVALLMARRNMNMLRRAPTKERKPPMNDEIAPGDLRVTTPNEKGKDEPLGVMSRDEALAKAKEMGGLDLILVNPNSDPPVCKIADYSKYRYMKEKKAKELKKNSKATEVKEVKMSYKIDVHDYEVRKKNAVKFLKQGNRVKCSIQFRGREVQHDKLGFELLDKLAGEMEDIATREGRPKREGRNLSMIVTPRPEVVKQVNADRRAEDKAKRKKKEQRLQDKKVAAEAEKAAAVAATASAVDASKEDEPIDTGDDLLDLEKDIESSLDDLFGSDDLTDDLFS